MSIFDCHAPRDINGFAAIGRIESVEHWNAIALRSGADQLHPGDVLLFEGPYGPRGLGQIAEIARHNVLMRDILPYGTTKKDFVYVARALGERAFKVRA